MTAKKAKEPTAEKPKGKPRPKRKYEDKDKAAVLTLLDWNTGNVRKTATDTGVPEATIRAWVEHKKTNPEVAKAVEEMEGSLADQIEQTIRVALVAARKKLPKASLGAINSTVSMLAEKHQVINDRPSSISDVRGDKLGVLAEILAAAAERKEKAEKK